MGSTALSKASRDQGRVLKSGFTAVGSSCSKNHYLLLLDDARPPNTVKSVLTVICL
jgi:hypothetical protein